MQIAIIGAGHVGGALGKGWARAGHAIRYGVRDPSSTVLAADVAGKAMVGTTPDAIRGADLIVLAVHWQDVPDALKACGDLSGRILIDATNPLAFGPDGISLALGFDRSGSEEVAARCPGALVFKTLNQVGYEVMADTSGFVAPPVMFIAGPQGTALQQVSQLVTDLGFAAKWVGNLALARLLEPYAMLWIHTALSGRMPQDSAFALLNRAGDAS